MTYKQSIYYEMPLRDDIYVCTLTAKNIYIYLDKKLYHKQVCILKKTESIFTY